MWPPEYPENIPHKASLLSKRSYFEHQKHMQAVEVSRGSCCSRPGSQAVSFPCTACDLRVCCQLAWLAMTLTQCTVRHVCPVCPALYPATLSMQNSPAFPFPPLPLQLRAAEDKEGKLTFFEENPRLPYRGAKIMSSQPQFLKDFSTGLNTTSFQ